MRNGAPAQPRSRLASGGEPIPDSFRALAEPRLSADLSQVRIHRDKEAVQMSERIGARAFTVGADVFMGHNEGILNTPSGRRTLMHELAHTIQQQHNGLEIQRQIIVAGEPWLELRKVRDKFGERGVEIYLKMRDDPGIFEYPSEEALFQEIELRLLAVKMMTKIEVSGVAEGDPSTFDSADTCCKYPAANEHFRLNEQHWTAESNNPPIFKLKEGARPSVAVRSIFVPRAGSVLDCGMFIVALRYRALLESMGSKEFDMAFQGDRAPVISKLHESASERGLHPLLSSGYVKDEAVEFNRSNPSKNLIPGDQVYFRNHHSYEGRLWHGEHALYIGNGLFVGFGLAEIDRSEEHPMDLYDDKTGNNTGYTKYAVTYDEMIAKLRRKLPTNEQANADIPGLRSKDDPEYMSIRRPSLPGNHYEYGY